jgi:hypothetical protein
MSGSGMAKEKTTRQCPVFDTEAMRLRKAKAHFWMRAELKGRTT